MGKKVTRKNIERLGKVLPDDLSANRIYRCPICKLDVRGGDLLHHIITQHKNSEVTILLNSCNSMDESRIGIEESDNSWQKQRERVIARYRMRVKAKSSQVKKHTKPHTIKHKLQQRKVPISRKVAIRSRHKSNLVAKIHQGRYDTEHELLNLRRNAERIKNDVVIDAVHQRLKIVAPAVYQRLIGPLYKRIRDKRFNCYCNNPASLQEVYEDIMNDRVPRDALTCDACWQEDLAKTWGYYGWSSKLIPQKLWEELCDKRAYAKYV